MKRIAISSLVLISSWMAAGCDRGTTTATTNSATPPSSAPVAASVVTPGNSVVTTSATLPAEDGQAEDELRDHHRHHHHGGVAMFIAMAIDTLGVAPEKKVQLEKIQSNLRAKMAPAHDAEKTVLSTLADGVAAGTIDKPKVDAALTKLEGTSAAIHGASQDALNQLHSALSPVERAVLVDKVKAHAEVWKKVNTDEEVGSHEKGSHLARLTQRLNLTPDQVDKIGAALKSNAPAKPDGAAVESHINAFATAFVAESFDAKSLATTGNAANAHIAKQGAERMARFYEVVTPLLTPDQRTKLADHLRDRLNDQPGSTNEKK